MKLEKLMNIDRRIIFVAIFLVVTIPFFLKFNIPIRTTAETRGIYNHIDNLPKGSIILLSTDYDLASRPELYPMAKAIVRHAFKKGHRVVSMCLWPNGAGLAESCITEVAAEMNKKRAAGNKLKHGKDYLIVGYRPGFNLVMLSIGNSFSRTFRMSSQITETIDGKNVVTPATDLAEVEKLPIMKDIKNYSSFGVTVVLGAGASPDAWIMFVGARFRQPIGLGVTGVSAPRYYPFFPGQIVGLIGGLKGAAEYEVLVEHKDWAVKGMDAQSASHLLIILFIFIGNIAYFLTKKK